jgi:hypothetical protein
MEEKLTAIDKFHADFISRVTFPHLKHLLLCGNKKLPLKKNLKSQSKNMAGIQITVQIQNHLKRITLSHEVFPHLGHGKDENAILISPFVVRVR